MTTKKKTKLAPPSEPATQSLLPSAEFPIVGIGASAGGLAAFEAFLSGMPTDSDPGMAFVLVQHLAPDHKSILSELVRSYTRMQVFEVEDSIQVQPNCTYIIPPNHDMALLNGALHLLQPSAPRGQRLPIDFFFHSLAQDQRERAICIVLSGTGSDGTLGARAVKDGGGLVMVQTPASTEYDGMPRSAINTGLVDFVLLPAEMPAQLITHVAHVFGKVLRPPYPPAHKTEDVLGKIFILLRAQTGHDFSQYKQKTIARRIERRMAVQQIDQLEAYLRYLQQTPAEVEALFRDLLIGVTSFFRDPEAFAVLQEQAIPRLFDDKPANALIRVWAPGCANGEEAYSIAILLQEQMEKLKRNFQVQIFATDIDRQAIAQARSGRYPASIAADISPERLARFFVGEPDDSAYRIQKGIRDMMIFSEQDVIRDPPFSKLDLISCRNLLIYMGGELQKKLIGLFYSALKPGGFLFLGTSETIGEGADLFTMLDRKSKLYQSSHEPHPLHRIPIGTIVPPLPEGALAVPLAGKAVRDGKLQLRGLTERALLQQYVAVGALVNERGEILYLHGRTGHFLEPAPGEANLNILKMAREGLGRALTSALHQAVVRREPARYPNLRVKTNGDFTLVNLTVRPVMEGSFDDNQTPALKAGSPAAVKRNLYLVILEEGAEQEHLLVQPADMERGAGEPDVHILALKQELHIKEEYLQTTQEELETSKEELTSTIEELQSVNEELQSTNEEMETSKEELESVNEELSTVNAELQQKVTDLSRATNDMNNLLAGTDIGTIFVDHQARILRFTPAITQVINLILSDVGRPVADIVFKIWGYDRLAVDVQSVLDSLLSIEVEVQAHSGEWYLLRIRPYRTLENVIEGAVITFTVVTEMKKAQAALQETEALRRLAVVVKDASDAITVQGLDGRILAWNPAAEKMYGWSEAEALAMNIRECILESNRKGELTRVQQLSRAEVLEPIRTPRLTKNGQIIKVLLIATALVNEGGEMYAISTTERLIKPSKGENDNV